MNGYGAYGLKDERWKYSGTLTYSFNKRDYVVWEFPKHYISATYSYDVMSPMDKFLFTDKDNIFLSLKTTTVDQMSYMRDATINYELETLTGFGIKAMLRHRNDEPAGKLEYLRNDAAQTRVHDVTTAEASLTLRYAPGESFVNSKQRRIPVSLDAPIFTLSSCHGIQRSVRWRIQFQPYGSECMETFLASIFVGKDRLQYKGRGRVEHRSFPVTDSAGSQLIIHHPTRDVQPY